jgi:hypothetical protein
VKRLARLIVRLYPAMWRRRYGGELEALLDGSGSGWFVIVDLLKEATRMQLTTWSFGKLAATLGIAGLLVAALISALIPPAYVSDVVVHIYPAYIHLAPVVNYGRLTERIARIEDEAFSRRSLSKIIQDPRLDLYRSDRQTKPLENVIAKMRNKDIRISLISEPDSIDQRVRLSFAYPDSVKARNTVRALIDRFMEANITTQRLRPQIDMENMQVFDLPDLPKHAKPDRYSIILIGPITGVVLAVAAKLLLKFSAATSA